MGENRTAGRELDADKSIYSSSADRREDLEKLGDGILLTEGDR